MIPPEEIIEAIRKSDSYIECIYMQGGCYQFHLFLKRIYPDAEPYLHLDGDHVVSKIGKKYYDIRGSLKKGHSFLYEKLTHDDLEKVESWSFSKHNALKISECEFCEEPFLI